MDKTSLLAKASRLFATVSAQAVWSGTNFIVVILLARHLSINEFGVLGLYLTIKRGVVLVAGALIVVPMTIVSTRKEDIGKEAFAPRVVNTFLGIGFATISLCAMVNIIWGYHFAEGAVLLVGAITLEIQRRVHYLDKRITADMVGAAFNIVGVLVSLWILASSYELTLSRAILVVGFFNMAWVVIAHGRHVLDFGIIGAGEWRAMWGIGGWGLGSSLATFLYSQISTFYTLFFIGAAGVAVLEMGRQFIGVLQPMLFGMANYFQPRLAASAQNESSARFLRKLWRLTGVQVIFGALVMLVVIMVFPVLLSILVPGKFDLYQESVPVASILAVAALLQIAWRQPGFAVVALGHPFYSFLARVVGASVVIPAGIFLTYQYGVTGAAWTKLIGDGVILIVSVLLLNRVVQVSRPGDNY